MTVKRPFFYGADVTTFRRAKSLRKKLTPAEDYLWQALRNRSIANSKFRRQHPVGPFIVDFFCNAAELVIEIDGGIHDVPKVIEYDKARQEYLENLGLHILRFRNEEVLVNIGNVLDEIEKYLVSKRPHPGPLPEGAAS